MSNRAQLLVCASLVLLLSWGTGQAAMDAHSDPPPQATDPLLVYNAWVDVPLTQILRDISMQLGVMIALDPSVTDYLVSLEAQGTPLEACLRKVTAAQGLVVRKIEDRLYVVGSTRPGSPSFSQLADTQRIPLEYVTAKHVLQSLPQELRQYVSSGLRESEVLAFAPSEQMERILEIVRQLDMPRQQIVLEALIVELSQEAGSEVGLDWQWSGPDTVLGFAESTGAFMGAARYTSINERDFKSLTLTLRMLVQDGKATIRSRPRVATLNGEKATIDISLEEYFTIAKDINGGYLRTELQVVKSGVLLEMTPQIGHEGDVTVDISTEVSDVASRRNSLEDGNGDAIAGTLPVIRRRRADTKVRVKEGDAIVIGGLVESVEREEIKRVPILGRIPFLGALFRSTRTSTIEREVVIFITPRLMAAGQSPLSDRHSMVNVDHELSNVAREQSPETP